MGSGFYIDSPLFPSPSVIRSGPSATPVTDTLLLGPFCGKPACQHIKYAPGKVRGVCADAYVQRRTLVVPNVEAYPGHIACDGETKSEIVIPMMVQADALNAATTDNTALRAIGVLDLDCLALNGFDEEDRVGLEKIAKLVVDACDW
jgi:L-methionine (R)-S-oxide reductase